jgi:hypothetical protein
MKKVFVITSLIVFYLSITTYGDIYPTAYKSIRAQGMGGAYVAVADDPSSLFLNPAGLSNLSGNYLEVLDVQGELGQGSLQNILDLYEATTTTGTESEKDAAVIDAVQALTGTYSVAEAHVSFLSYYWKNRKKWGSLGVGFSPYSHSQASIYIRNQSNQITQIRLESSSGGALGFGLNFSNVPGLSMGLTNRTFYHLETDGMYGLSDLQDSTFSEDLQESLTGSGKVYTSFDLGLLYEYRLANWVFGLGASMPNTYTTSEDLRVLNGGFQVKAIWLNQFITRITAEHKDLFYAYSEDNSVFKRLHGGAELEWGNPILRIAVRGGVHQGYLSYGATIDLNYLEIEYAHYTEEIGAYAGQVGSPRDLVRISMGF